MTFVKYILHCVAEGLDSITGGKADSFKSVLVASLTVFFLTGVIVLSHFLIKKHLAFNDRVTTILAILSTIVLVIVIFTIAILIEYIVKH